MRVQRMLEGLQAEGEAEVLVHYTLAEDIRALKRVKDAMAQGRPLGLQVTPRGSPDAAVVIDLQALREVSVVSALFDRGQVPTTALTDGVVTGELGPLKGLRARPTPALLASTRPVRNVEPKVGRNDPCPCGSGKKFKKCCGP